MKHTGCIKTVLGWIRISEAGGFVTELSFVKAGPDMADGLQAPVLKEAAKQLEEYLSGRRKVFDLPLAAEGTMFQKLVWRALREIPYGETRSYKQIAERIGRPKAARAVGMANHKNPILIVTPCHRVIGANGKLTGYAGGLLVKEKLLDLERIYAGG